MDDRPLKGQMKKAADLARRRNRRYRKALDAGDFAGAMQVFKAPEQQAPQHYHIIYHVKKDGLAIPYFRVAFPTQRLAMQHIFHLGQQAEPNTEYYDDGTVGLEMAMPGRVGLWWIRLEVAGCIATECRPRRDSHLMAVPEPEPEAEAEAEVDPPTIVLLPKGAS